MSEYIDRTALGIGRANREIFKDPAYADGWNAVLEIIQAVPAADVAPVVHAQWGNRSGIITCSKCGQGHMLAMYPHYCDNCGAKMDEERSDHD